MYLFVNMMWGGVLYAGIVYLMVGSCVFVHEYGVGSVFVWLQMVVHAMSLLGEGLDIDMIGIKKETGGSYGDSRVISGVAFKKTFSYAGFEQQPKKIINPKILLLNLELELKAEKENAEVRLSNPDVRTQIFLSPFYFIYLFVYLFIYLFITSVSFLVYLFIYLFILLLSSF